MERSICFRFVSRVPVVAFTWNAGILPQVKPTTTPTSESKMAAQHINSSEKVLVLFISINKLAVCSVSQPLDVNMIIQHDYFGRILCVFID